MGSTNGTFVEGERLTGETALSPGTTLKFGDVSALFEPLDDTVPPERAGSTRLMPQIEPEIPRTRPPASQGEQPAVQESPVAVEPDPAAVRPRPRPRRPIHMAPPRPKSPSTLTVVGLVILVAILAYLLSSL
jgi:pSer/pThr/pTyr-binding forkhead associated (FHA) protein